MFSLPPERLSGVLEKEGAKLNLRIRGQLTRMM